MTKHCIFLLVSEILQTTHFLTQRCLADQQYSNLKANLINKQFKSKWQKISTAAAAAKSFQSCPTLCDPIDGSTPGSPVPGILQERTLEWVAISFSNAYHSQLIFYFNDNAIFLSFKEWNLPKMPNIWCILWLNQNYDIKIQ